MKSFIYIIGSIITLTLGANFAHSETVIKLGHVTQTSHPFHIGATMFKDTVEARSDGKIGIQLYPARQLGDDKQLIEGVQLGTIDAAIVSSAVFSGFTPVMDALQLPFLIDSYDQLSDALTSSVSKDMLRSLEKIGLKGLGYYEGGQRNLLVAKKSAKSLEDLQGLKIRVVPAKLHLDIWDSVGSSPTPMPYGEIYTSLQTSVLDGAEINITSVYSEKLYEVAGYLTKSKHYFWPGILIINPRVYNRMSEEEKKILSEAAHDTIAPQIAAAEAKEKEAEQELLNAGLKIYEINEKNHLLSAVDSVIEKYASKDPLVSEFIKHVNQNK